ncbi:hypothetical protein KVP09_02840 [Alcaligenaceae bacterium CGII-47]|nr:hypothetical protein [Alcaligenaceae bacterium CGII-47]
MLLNDPRFFALLLHIDQELARECQSTGCPCGGVLHQANYPRKPRGCPREAREDCSSRFSFCCSRCRKRCTAQSVRFMGRRVYLTLAVVLRCGARAGSPATQARLGQVLAVSTRTLGRWRHWWTHHFPVTPLWRATCARFMPPVPTGDLPAALLARFVGSPPRALAQLLAFLTPLSVRQ